MITFVADVHKCEGSNFGFLCKSKLLHILLCNLAVYQASLFWYSWHG